MAVQASLVTTLVPSRLRTYSLVTMRQLCREEECRWRERNMSYRVLQVPLAVSQCGNFSRL